MKLFRSLLTGLLVLCLAVMPALALGEAATAVQSGDQQKENAPDTSLFDSLAEFMPELSQHKGKALFFNFFTEWCPYCMQEMPEIKKVFDQYSKDELEIILVHVWDGEDEKNTQNIKDKYGLENMTFYEDKDMSFARTIGLPGYPTSLFIHKDGAFAGQVSYALDETALTQIMEYLKVQKAPEATEGPAQ